MVVMLIVALATSKRVPPMDPVMMLLANQRRVLASSMARKGTPFSVKIATVAMQEPMIGSQPALVRANARPRPMLAQNITAPSTHER